MASGIHNRGFASMNIEKKREIARKGGRAVHLKGVAHEFTKGSKEARDAGTKGGESVSSNRGSDYMAEIGRRGAFVSAKVRAEQARITAELKKTLANGKLPKSK